MSWQQFFILASAHFLALVSPGPDFFLLLNHALAHGRRAGYRTARGIAAANAFYIVAALCGVAWLHTSPQAYALVYWSGCAYLAWLGWQFWRAVPTPIRLDAGQSDHGRPAFFARGFASGVLNPKNAIFYLTLFTVLAGRNSSALGRALAGAWMGLAVLAWDCLVCWLFTRARLLSVFSRQQALLHRGSAWVLFCIVGAMIWSRI
jgi:threonine/homoserine/homoserine lactone efflux protein